MYYKREGEQMEVYFDNSATTKPCDEAIEAVVDVMKNYYGNPSSSHNLGLKAEMKLSEARETAARFLNCTKGEIFFTSGGSESNNFLIRGFVKPGNHVITTAIEHPSIINTCRELEREGVRVTYLKVDGNGRIDLDELKNEICKDTVIVSIMHVNNEIGSIAQIEEIGKIIREKSKRAKFHIDAVQSFGKLRINVQKCNIDLLSASGHKIAGPRGVGLAYVRKGLIPRPLIYGGGQEAGFRSGTENLPAIAGFACAIKKADVALEENYNKVSSIKKHFLDNIVEIDDIRINDSDTCIFLPYVLNISFLGVRGEALLHALEDEGIFVATGSACSSNVKNSRSYVLKEIGLLDREIDGTIRFSFNPINTTVEVDYTIDKLKKCLNFLRRIKV
jgi:cysteine desulfurase